MIAPAGPLLEVEGLSVTFPTDAGPVGAVADISFHVTSGETLAVVGESGSGKSVTGLALMGLHPKSTRIEGSIRFEGQELLGLKDNAWRALRGSKIAMIFQDPMTAMNPVFTVGDQIIEMLREHVDILSKKNAKTRAIELLELVGVPQPARRVDQYPHEFSGGMRQRAMIALAIANFPRLLIADEPTTALDVTIQAQVMEAMRAAQRVTGAAMILITHDLGLVAGSADRIHVMYGGRIFEKGDLEDIFYNSRNPYTRALLESIPSLGARSTDRLRPIPGSPPSLLHPPAGCPFRPRCSMAVEHCIEAVPDLVAVGDQHDSRCFRVDDLAALAVRGPQVTAAAPPPPPPLLRLEELTTRFPVRAGLLRRTVGYVHAVESVSLELGRNEILGVVGESGCGKTTLGRSLLRLIEPTSGRIVYEGEDITNVGALECASCARSSRSSFRIRTPRSTRGCRSTTSSRSRCESTGCRQRRSGRESMRCSGRSGSCQSTVIGTRTSSPVDSGNASASLVLSRCSRSSWC